MNIENIRKDYSLTQKELSEYLGVSSQTISNWECGRTSPTSKHILDKLKELQSD